MGPQRGTLLWQELAIGTFEDLLYHYPYRYFDRTKITPIGEVAEAMEYVQIAGTLINISEEGGNKRKRLTATLYDNTGRIELLWFQGIPWIKKALKENEKYVVFGKVSLFNGYYNIAHPEIDAWTADTNTVGLQPVYPTTEKLRITGITNRSFAKLTHHLFEKIKPQDIPEVLPAYLLSRYNLCSRYHAMKWIHFPDSEEQAQIAQIRIKWEELFLSQIKIGSLRLQHIAQQGWKFEKVGDHFNEFFKQYLPFELTNAQKRVIREIRTDTGTGKQMNRLLQGDVGSGKTIVALMIMLLALDNGFQACLMAPTEILAQQHYISIHELLSEMGITVKLLTGNVKGKERKEILAALENGLIHIVIGTHALIEDSVKFKNLGLAIIDEQHRFGVGQRARLWTKNTLPPHVLVMTATPIPRSLAMTMFGDLEVSTIDELPPGRQPIKTVYRKDEARVGVMNFLKEEVDKGRQVYVVYPLIEESEKLDYENLQQGYEQVKSYFNEDKYKIAIVHGKQDTVTREQNMKRFAKGEANILVATTVIEVGVNVPNASVMLIESAERFGLSQLHQLRGRVGRGAEQSYCILLTGNRISEESYKRMKILVSTNNGFEISKADLEMRGPGDLHGTQQSGIMKFKLADIVKDINILTDTRNAAKELLDKDPQLLASEHYGIRSMLQVEIQQSNWSKIL